MPFAASGLTPLIQSSGFSMWRYVTADLRADVAATGYFSAVASQFRPGDIMFLQAADALAMLPLRAGPAFGPGVTLDGAVTPLAAIRQAAQRFSVTQAVGAVVRTIVLAPLAAGFIAGSAIPVSAQVQGPISQVVVSVRNAAGQTVVANQLVTVAGGFATAAMAAPPVGTGYRIRMEDAQDPGLAATSRSFSVAPPAEALMQENGFVILMENGFALLR
jgi:hypothetical protein